MARGTCTFKQRDVTAALKAAAKAGITVGRFEIDKEGKIVVTATNGPGKEAPAKEGNEWDS